MEDIRKCKKRGRRGLSWTSAQKGLSKTVAPREGGVAATGCACVGFGAVRAGGFCPWRPLEVRKPWHARTFAAAELAASMTLKSWWVQKPRP